MGVSDDMDEYLDPFPGAGGEGGSTGSNGGVSGWAIGSDCPPPSLGYLQSPPSDQIRWPFRFFEGDATLGGSCRGEGIITIIWDGLSLVRVRKDTESVPAGRTHMYVDGTPPFVLPEAEQV